MKIILSKKGTDTSYGRIPSPIFPDGTILSIPIPNEEKSTTYWEINIDAPGYNNMGALVDAYRRKSISSKHFAHLDPDINPASLTRDAGWKPAFGQSEGALGHLNDEGVGKGDLFLFYGWYRDVETINDKLKQKGPNRQVIWGWLQIGEILYTKEIYNNPEYAWLQKAHPHMQAGKMEQDAVFIATNKLTLPNGKTTNLPGAGVFNKYREILDLSDPNYYQLTRWRLPEFFYPFDGRKPLSYNSNEEKWTIGDDCVHLKRPSRGQEFVLSEEYINDASSWLDKIFNI